MNTYTMRFEKYELKLNPSIMVCGNVLSNRKGFNIKITNSNEVSAFGYISPLKYFHKESFDDVSKQLKLLPEILSFSKQMKNPFDIDFLAFYNWSLYPSVQLGLEMAFINLFTTEQRLEDKYNKKINVNGLIYSGSDTLLDDVNKLINTGYKSIKVKVNGNPKSMAKKIIQIKNVLPETVSLRLDANRQWDFETALEFANLAKYNKIEYIEEPFYTDDLTGKKYQEFSRITGFNIALDESFTEHKTFYEGMHSLVLKPSLYGSISTIKNIVKIAKEKNVQVVISHAMQPIQSITFFKQLVIELKLSHICMGLDKY